MIRGDNFKIMVRGELVDMAESTHFTIVEDNASTKEHPENWKPTSITQSYDITGNAIIHEAGNVLRDLLNRKQMLDVIICQEIGKLPRKMKKALRSDCRRITKWKRKVASYINRRQIRIHNAEINIEEDKQ